MVRGTIVAIEDDYVVVDVGLKTEGRVPLREFEQGRRGRASSVGENVEVFLERIENKNGEVVLSREKARREEAWTNLEKAFNAQASA